MTLSKLYQALALFSASVRKDTKLPSRIRRVARARTSIIWPHSWFSDKQNLLCSNQYSKAAKFVETPTALPCHLHI